MRRKIALLALSIALMTGSVTACASEPAVSEEDLQAKYDEGYNTGYEEGYAKGSEEGVSDFRARTGTFRTHPRPLR